MKQHSNSTIGVITSTLVLSVFCCAPIHAGLIFGTGVFGGTQNIGSFSPLTATTATGQLLGSGTTVLLATSDVTLSGPAAGAAVLEAVGTPFTTVLFERIPSTQYFEVFEMNIRRFGAGTFTLTVVDNNSNVHVSSAFVMGSGVNRVWAQGTDGDLIKSIRVTASGALMSSISQVRVVTAIPEPTALMLVGSIIGLGAFRRRR